jgi:Sulfotransferase family
MSFDQFVEWMKFSSCTCTRALPHRYQLDWFVSPHGDILVDFIGRYESLQSDWAKIAARLNANPHLPKKRVNTERERDYSKYYSDRTKRIIAERFAVDIEYFGYKFGD